MTHGLAGVPRLRSRAAILMMTLALAASAARADGHEIGTTRVTATLAGGHYGVDIVTDAPSLVDKLSATAHEATLQGSERDDADRLASRLRALDAVFRRKVALAFDGTAAVPAVSLTVAPAKDVTSPILATVHLSGAIPPTARTVTWSYGWTFASYALSVRHGADGAASTEWLEGDAVSTPVGLTAQARPLGRAEVARRYLSLGFTHIVPLGLDHMLFVLGIFLLSRRMGSVLAQVSAFTVAHSITLGLSIYGLLSVPASVVEPLIAVSIAYVAIENLVVSELRPWRIALVFAFGLLHGMGFAGALQELGLPRSEFLTALVTFNVGVEAGQLAVIGAAFALVGWPWGRRDWYRQRIVVPASFVIALVALYWTVARVVHA